MGAFAQELPPVVNFSPESYGAENQNWMISQSNSGHIFIANNKGLLEFDGANWVLYPSPNQSIIRSVKVIGDKIYTGCYQNFGFWQRNEKGTLDYTSLSDTLTIPLVEDEQFWNIIQHHNWLLFQSFDRILILNYVTDEISIIDAENPITKIFQSADEIFFQVTGEGLYTIDNGDKLLLDNSSVAKSSRIINLFTLENDIFFITEKNGFYKLKDSQLEPWDHPLKDLISNLSIYSSLQTKEGSIVLGTISNGIFHISSDGDLLYNLNQTNGLSNNTALALFEDRDSNIWLGLDNGLDCINAHTPIQNYVDRKGRIGTTYASALYKDHLYLGTNQGLFYRPINEAGDFQLIDGSAGLVLYLKVIDDTLFCGHNLGTFLVKEDRLDMISEVQGAWDIKRVHDHPDLLLQGNYDGLYIFEKKNDSWGIRNKLEGYNISSKHFELTNKNTILVNHEYKGVYELLVDPELSKVERSSKIESLARSAHSSLVEYDDEIIYASEDGIFLYDQAKHKFARDEQLSLIFKNGEYISGRLIADDNYGLWAFTRSYLYHITKEKIGNSLRAEKIAIPQILRNEMEGYENISYFKDGRFILGVSDGYMMIQPEEKAEKMYDIEIKQVISSSFRGTNSLLPLDTSPTLKSDENNFIFRYSVPQYEKYAITEYQYTLDSENPDWSPWITSPSVEIKNLKHGTYQFQVRGRVNNQKTRNIASYNFVIEKPWFLSNEAIVLYIILTVLLFLGINWFYKRYYRKQRARILEKTTNELKLKELASQKEIIQLKNEGLNQDIEARNRELAISTMNMINKNTALKRIKDEISKINGNTDYKSVISLIDGSLNSKEDWKFFEEAFNHADKDFFKNVKERHPDLTTSDLRLCVYLRLNLSSKEIAPLLNISPRSVEIKRYRLRKKIQLDREIGLNNYFIDL